MGLQIVQKLKTTKDDQLASAQEEAPKFEQVTWYRDPGLRQLYCYAFVLCIASATTGYDGSVAVLPLATDTELEDCAALYSAGC